MLRYSIVAFLTGAAVMIAEIAAARAIAPHFGTSIVVWTNVIGIILVALSAGYWIGGRMAERRPRAHVLGTMIAIAGALLIIPAFATPAIADFVIGGFLRAGSGFLILFIGSFVSIVALFALPIFLLGTVSPFLVKLASDGRSDIGAIAGRLYAVSTIGSLVGTFLPTLVLLPTFGTRRTILGAAATLLILGLALALHGRSRAGSISGVIVIVMVMVGIPDHPLPWFLGGRVVAAAESRYQYLRIVEYPRQDHGEQLGLLFNEGFGVQSVSVNPDAVPDGYFTVTAALPALLDRDAVRVLILGNAGGTVGNLMQRFFPDHAIAITGVELDPAVTALTAAYFTPPIHPYPVIHADSRAFVRGSSARYDIIIVDAYTNQLTIPSHLATREFYALLRDHLAPDGIVVANVNAPRDDSRLFRTIVQTIADVFPYAVEGPAGAWNRLIIAGTAPPNMDRLASASLPRALRDPDGDLTEFLQFVQPIARDRASRIFTDDWAPLELMTDIEIFEALRGWRS